MIQDTDPRLDVVMVEMQKRLNEFLMREVPFLCANVGIKGKFVLDIKGASYGGSNEIMLISTIKFVEINPIKNDLVKDDTTKH